MAHAVGTAAVAGSGGPTETVARCHAGIVVSVDPTTRRFVLEEMSPGRQARRIVVQVEPGGSLVEIAREAEAVVVDRTPEAVEIAESHRYVERPIDLVRMKPGDFVVVVLDKQSAENQPVPARRVELTDEHEG